ncbi:MAG: N-acetylmuramic acid 6-phosphate etherase [Deferribacteres bacterium]|nr:N-acetylmuramic acid 6-phosphate etherase [candidate division KSB1 bacterium]MCB9502919.1 N-acetylmuramic acid 6-phosphate etherase [Deferribacteres bacterium]
MSKTVYDEIKNLVTEAQNTATKNIDTASVETVLTLMNNEDKQVPEAVERELAYIAEAVKIIVKTFKKGGRLFYIGAGTSGRLGVLDASECPPTFGTDPGMVRGIIAGGDKALKSAMEGAEDDFDQGREDLKEAGFTSKDVVCGIAASKRTPYVIGAVEYARSIGAKTLYVTCNPRENFDIPVDVAICTVVGPEVVMGSTRMKAGTATKLVLNMLTTASMIRLGKTYGNMMVDLMMTSKKLEERSKRTVMLVTGVSYDESAEILKNANGHVKTALVMHLAGVSQEEAKARLVSADGFVRKAINK